MKRAPVLRLGRPSSLESLAKPSSSAVLSLPGSVLPAAAACSCALSSPGSGLASSHLFGRRLEGIAARLQPSLPGRTDEGPEKRESEECWECFERLGKLSVCLHRWSHLAMPQADGEKLLAQLSGNSALDGLKVHG